MGKGKKDVVSSDRVSTTTTPLPSSTTTGSNIVINKPQPTPL